MTSARDRGAADPRSERAGLFLSAAALIALAVAQPVLDLLGRTPQFFTARAASTFEVVIVGLVLGIGLPLVVAAAAAGGHALNRYAGLAVHGVVMAVGGGLLVAEALQHTPAAGWPGSVQLAAAGVAGVALVLGYHRAASIRGMLRYVAVAPVAVAALFLVVAPTSRLVWGASGVAMAAGPVANPAPVVVVIFDEFPVATLIDGSGRIRTEPFPGFARLAAGSTWFRNAVGAHERTEQALPAMLSGRLAPEDDRTPSAAEYPDTLFSLVADGYTVQAVESVTTLCPPTVCVDGSRRRPPLTTWWRSLAGDLAVVGGHVLLPEGLARGLPPIDEGWSGFLPSEAPSEPTLPPEDSSEETVNSRFNEAVDNDRRRALADFELRLDDPLAADQLLVGHFLLPHSPWTILPDGRRYPVSRVHPGDWAVWTDDAWLVEQAYQSHLLQVQYVDRFVGDLIDRLEELGSYHDALVVVTADHGVAIRPGTDRRVITANNVGEVAAVPLFVKRPGQLRGEISDYRAETTDILPTVAALLGVEVPWPVTGVDLFASDLPARHTSTMHGSEGPVTFGVDGSEKLAVARYHERWFAGDDPYGLAPPGHHDLLGVEVADLAVVDAADGKVSLDQRPPFADLDTDVVDALISGTVTGIGGGQHVVAVAVDGRIVAVTRTWVGGGLTQFQAMLPPAAFEAGSMPRFYLVNGARLERTLAPFDG